MFKYMTQIVQDEVHKYSHTGRIDKLKTEFRGIIKYNISILFNMANACFMLTLNSMFNLIVNSKYLVTLSSPYPGNELALFAFICFKIQLKINLIFKWVLLKSLH